MSDDRTRCVTTACLALTDGPNLTAARKVICHACIARARRDLRTIADNWRAAHRSLRPTATTDDDPVTGSRAMPLPVDTDVADRIRAARSMVWFLTRLVHDEREVEKLDDDGEVELVPPDLPGDHSTPTLARWLADEHMEWVAGHDDAALVQGICDDLDHHARSVLWCVAPVRPRRVPIPGLRCTEHATSDMGERVECTGSLVAILGVKDGLPDLVCTHDRAHVVDPATWTSKGFNRTAMHQGAALDLRRAIVGS